MRKLKLKLNEGLLQQGDVILQRIDSEAIPQGLVKQKDLVLQLGEVTGHKHQFKTDAEDRVSIFSSKDAVDAKGFAKNITPDMGRYVIIEGDQAIPLVHEEHKTIMVPPGTYKISIVYEYDYEKQMLSYVAD